MSQSTSREFFSEVKDWSKRKHQILDMYLASASKILGSRWKTVVYLDGFAGRGTYGEGASAAKGSPLKAAELARQYADNRKPYSLRCINVEDDDENFADLQAVTQPFGDLVTNLSGTFAGNINRILKLMEGCAAVCFLDPFGLKGIDWVAIEQLIRRRDATDLWIRFDYRTARRLHGFADAEDTRGQGKWGTLARVYGIDDRSELHKRLSGPTPERRLENALRFYMERLLEEFYKSRHAGYVASYSIRSLDKRDKYQMVFATGHYKGVILASDIVYRVEETYQKNLQDYKTRQQMGQIQQLSLFDTAPKEPTEEEVFAYEVAALKSAVWEIGVGRTMLRRDIYCTLIQDGWFGKITSRHLTTALKDLKTEGQILTIDGAASKDDAMLKFASVQPPVSPTRDV